jgi:ActR/RegA family two-component response regulator
MIAEVLRRTSGNVSRAARELGITRRGLQLKLGRHQRSEVRDQRSDL